MKGTARARKRASEPASERKKQIALRKAVLRTLWTLHAELIGVSQAGDTS